jgi:4-amino-4-deoxy-L-arabinose transferase-like glycosyltransferase
LNALFYFSSHKKSTNVLQKDLSKMTAWVLIAVLLVCIAGWFGSLRETAAAYYAARSLDFWLTANTSNQSAPDSSLMLWISAAATRIFGPNHIAYRIPSLFPVVISWLSVYRFARIHYKSEVALLAVIVLATTQSAFFLTNEVTPSTFQSGFYIFMVWQFAAYYKYRSVQHFVAALVAAVLLYLFNVPPVRMHHGIPDVISVLLVSFAPWTLFFLIGFVKRCAALFSSRMQRYPEFLSTIAILIPFLLFLVSRNLSLSAIFMLCPLGSVIVSEYIIGTFYSEDTKNRKRLYISQTALVYIALGLLFLLVWIPFPDKNYYGLIHFMATLSIITWLVFFSGVRHKMLITTLVLSIGGNLVLNTYFYPSLATCQAGSHLGILAKADGVQPGRFFSYQAGEPALLHFYAEVPVRENNDFKKLVSMKNCWVYTHEELVGEFRSLRPDVRVVGHSADFQNFRQLLTFLDPKTRELVITRKVLLKL